MTIDNDIAGTAALTICESLLLALNDLEILPDHEIIGILKDAETAHKYAPTGDQDKLNAAVAQLIHDMISGGHWVRQR